MVICRGIHGSERVLRHCPVSMSHSLRVLSEDARKFAWPQIFQIPGKNLAAAGKEAEVKRVRR
jgi:hypothetical protein